MFFGCLIVIGDLSVNLNFRRNVGKQWWAMEVGTKAATKSFTQIRVIVNYEKGIIKFHNIIIVCHN
jgi:hypothetical protein